MNTAIPALAMVALADGDQHLDDRRRLQVRATTDRAEAGPPWPYRAEWDITPAGELVPAAPVFLPKGY